MNRNVEIVRELYEAVTDGAEGENLSRFHPDVVWDASRSGLPEGGVYHGHEGVRDFWRRWRGAWESYTAHPEELIEVGGLVVAPVRLHARSKGTHLDVTHQITEVWTVEDGLVTMVRQYADREQALRDAKAQS
jgi:ketosteroid isomerase-like protein